MLKYGLICQVDYLNGFARVNFDEIGIVSGWLSLPSTSTKGTKHFIPLEINTQVAVLMHRDGEQGEIVKAVWSYDDKPPSWANKNIQGTQYSDGTIITYDTQVHKLNVELCSGGTFEVNGENELLNAILGVINSVTPILEAGNGTESVLRKALKTAIVGKNQGKWTKQ